MAKLKSFAKKLFGPPDVSKMRAEMDIAGLIRLISYRKDEALQKAAVDALVGIGNPTVTPLTDMLKNPNYPKQGKQLAAEVLIRIGEAAAGAVVNKCLFGVAQEYGKHILIRMGAAAVPALKRMMYTKSRTGKTLSWGQSMGFELLAEIGTPAVGALVTELLSWESHVNEAAAKALAKIGNDAFIPLIDLLIEEGLKKHEIENIKSALFALGVSDSAYIIRLVNNSELGNESKRRLVNILGWHSDENDVPILVDLLEIADQPLRDETAQALKGIGWEPNSVRLGAIYYTGLRDWENAGRYRDKAIPALLTCLEHLGEDETDEIAKLLAKIGDPRARPPLQEKLKSMESKIWALEREASSYRSDLDGDMEATSGDRREAYAGIDRSMKQARDLKAHAEVVKEALQTIGQT